jgi:hypothetical protein
VGVTYYQGDFDITFVKTGDTGTVTNNVAIANTVGWYLLGDGSSTYMTKNGSNYVSNWKDQSGAGNDLLQTTALKQPLYNASLGIVFDGSNTPGEGDFVKSANFTYNQPCFVYMVLRNRAYEADHGIADGAVNGYKLGQVTGGNIYMYAGNTGINITDEVLNTTDYYIIRALYNGVNSKGQVNNFTAKAVAGIGTAAWGGITIGARGTGNDAAQLTVKEAIFRNAADSAETEAAIFNYLATKHGFFLT